MKKIITFLLIPVLFLCFYSVNACSMYDNCTMDFITPIPVVGTADDALLPASSSTPLLGSVVSSDNSSSTDQTKDTYATSSEIEILQQDQNYLIDNATSTLITCYSNIVYNYVWGGEDSYQRCFGQYIETQRQIAYIQSMIDSLSSTTNQ